jgi:hypothetical protein
MLFKAKRRQAPPQVILLVQNLDVIVSAGDDLLGCVHDAEMLAAGQAGEQYRVLGAGRSRFLAEVVRLETIIVGRLLQARRWSAEATVKDRLARAAIRLFQAASSMIVDGIATRSPSEAADFNAGADAFAYMRRRALIARDATGASLLGRIEVTQGFLIWGLVPLGDTIDAARALRGALANAYLLPVAAGSEAVGFEERAFDDALSEIRQAS